MLLKFEDKFTNTVKKKKSWSFDQDFLAVLNIKKSNQNRFKFFKDTDRVLKIYDYLIENGIILDFD